MTELTRAAWEASEFLQSRLDHPGPEPERLLDELADDASAELIRGFGSRDLRRLRELLLDERWEPEARLTETPTGRAAEAGAAVLRAYWEGGPLFADLDDVDPVADIGFVLEEVQAADPEAPPLIAWDLYTAIEPRLQALGLDRIPLAGGSGRQSLRERMQRTEAAAEADRRFDAASTSATSQLLDRRWDELLDRLEGSPSLTIPGLADGRTNIRNRFDSEEVLQRHVDAIDAARTAGGDPAGPLHAMLVELEPPGDRAPHGLRTAVPWRRAVPFPEGEDRRAGWIWASSSILDSADLKDALWAAIRDRIDLVVFDPAGGWTFGASGIDGLLISRRPLLERVAERLDVDPSWIEEADVDVED